MSSTERPETRIASARRPFTSLAQSSSLAYLLGAAAGMLFASAVILGFTALLG